MILTVSIWGIIYIYIFLKKKSFFIYDLFMIEFMMKFKISGPTAWAREGPALRTIKNQKKT